MSQRTVEATRPALVRAPSGARFVTFRAVAIGLLLLPLNTYWLTWNVWYQYHISGDSSLFSTAVFVLIMVTGLSWLAGRLRPCWRLAPGELLVVYIMVTIGTTMCASGWDWMTNLPTFLVYPSRFATPGNGWATSILPLLPPWLTVTDPDAVTGYWEGWINPYSAPVWATWWRPILWWTSFVTALIGVLLCLNSLLRRRWVEEERMAFPIVEVPLSLVRPEPSIWSSRAFQLGAAVAALLGIISFASAYLPSLPTFSWTIDYGQYTRGIRPWSGIRQPFFWFSPFLIGLSYLVPVDLLFSLWVFTLIGKLQQVITIQGGWNTQTWGGPPYIDSQSVGAMLALIVLVLWLDRGYLKALLRGAVTGRGPLGDRREALPHRAALAGAVVGIAYLGWFLHHMGMSAAPAAAFVAFYLLVSLTISRFRAQLGPPHHELMAAGGVMVSVLGSRSFDGHTLTALTLLQPFTSNQRGNPSPLTLEALRMGQGESTLRALPVPIMLAAVVGTISLFWANIWLHYRDGAGTRSHMAPVLVPGYAFGALDADLRQPGSGNWGPVIAMAAGAAACTLLLALKLSYPTFPLHPVALPVSTGGGIEGTVAAVFIAWVIKAAVLRWGGHRTYRQTVYAAIGVIAGDVTVSCLANIVRQILGTPVSAGAG